MHDDLKSLGDGHLNELPDAPRKAARGISAPLLSIVVFCLILAAAALYFFYPTSQPQLPAPIPAAAPTPVTPIPTATPTPLPDPLAPTPRSLPTAEPLPALDNSDATVRVDLLATPALSALADWLTPDELIRKFVRAAFNLHQGKIVAQYRPVEGPNTPFKAQAIGRMATITAPQNEDTLIQTAVFRSPPKNQRRYDRYAQLATAVETQDLISLYQLYYPLLQQAYAELGEKPDNFHAVMLSALRSFLAAPNPVDEPEFILTSVQYQFLDPTLEALPNTQKLMLRMGKENRAAIEAKLLDIEQALAGLSGY